MIRQLRTDDAAAYVKLRREMLIDSPLAFASSPSDDLFGSLELRQVERDTASLSLGGDVRYPLLGERIVSHLYDLLEVLIAASYARDKVEHLKEASGKVNVLRYMLRLPKGGAELLDDIDHLGNRRVRSVGEMSENAFRVGVIRVERAVKERLSLAESEGLMPQELINAKPVSAAAAEFASNIRRTHRRLRRCIGCRLPNHSRPRKYLLR